MTRLITRIFDIFAKRRAMMFALLAFVVVILIVRCLSLQYKEDIYDFLPVDSNHHKALSAYQNISSADRVFIIFEHEDTATVDQDALVTAIESFCSVLDKEDEEGMAADITSTIDIEAFMEMANSMYSNIPYLLTEKDYNRIDTILTAEYISKRAEESKIALLFPTGGLLQSNIQRDPLNLFTPTISRLQDFNVGLNYELYDGYIFTSDLKQAIVMITSPFGASETSNNARLVELINNSIEKSLAEMPGIKAHPTGAPVIAVGNANRIKQDSILAIGLAVVLILALLLYVFRNIKELLLIILSISFGWLFAMAGISLIRPGISMIVIGIASVFIGIAVNYPLHLIAHVNHANSIRSSLKEIIQPLITGNITTVGAFLCLVPLKSTALQDLGIFGSLMLVGTIIFVMLFLPHLIKSDTRHKERILFPKLVNFSFESKKWIMCVVAIATVVFYFYSNRTTFDADMQNINYMTDEQRNDLASLQKIIGDSRNTTLHIASEATTLDGAIEKSEEIQERFDNIGKFCPIVKKQSITPFIPSANEQRERVSRWNRFISEKRELLYTVFPQEFARQGFVTKAFAPFYNIIETEIDTTCILQHDGLGELTRQFISEQNGTFTIIDKLEVNVDSLATVQEYIDKNIPCSYSFDIKSVNNAITKTLSDEFDYIGFSCGIIVFLFLWISFGRIELSLLSFLPMAISWIWILGLMGATGIQFNIVNIILATFIFGQGDDYTIFMSEGLIYEHAYKKKILAPFKNSIIISALIMFIGIGILIITKHPAMQSLAKVTIVGMVSVVLTAYIIPPFIFKFLTTKNGHERDFPITMGRLASMLVLRVLITIETITGIIIGITLFIFGGKSRWRSKTLALYAHHAARINIHLLPGVRVTIPKIKDGSAVAAYDPTPLEFMILVAISPRVIATGDNKGFMHTLFKLAGCICEDIPVTTPIAIHGAKDVIPRKSIIVNKGYILAIKGEPMPQGTLADVMLDSCRKLMLEGTASYLKAEHFAYFVKSRYFYKGSDVEKATRKSLRSRSYFSRWADCNIKEDNIVIINGGYGEAAMLFALVHPDKNVYSCEENNDKLAISCNIHNMPENLHIMDTKEIDETMFENATVFIIEPDKVQKEKYGNIKYTAI